MLQLGAIHESYCDAFSIVAISTNHDSWVSPCNFTMCAATTAFLWPQHPESVQIYNSLSRFDIVSCLLGI